MCMINIRRYKCFYRIRLGIFKFEMEHIAKKVVLIYNLEAKTNILSK